MGRWFIFVPEINSESFVFLSSRGASWTIRDYATSDGSPRSGRDYTHSLGDVLDMSLRTGNFRVDAPVMHTAQSDWYQAEIHRLNQRYLGSTGDTSTELGLPEEGAIPEFPIINLEALLRHAVKATKSNDMRRILTSPRSEDYVTWNVVQALTSRRADQWWEQLVAIAARDAGSSQFLPDPWDLPVLDLWRVVAPPPETERAMRERMLRSDDPSEVERARSPRPVEGDSEIDLVVEGESYIIFVEAKLDADISPGVKHDPNRNQIVRNIDAVIEEASDRTPHFWMFVKDKGRHRDYMNLVELYREEPERLAEALPHRDWDSLASIADTIAVIEWGEVLGLLSPFRQGESDALEEVAQRLAGSSTFVGMQSQSRSLNERIVEAVWAAFEHGAQLAADPKGPGGTPEWWIFYALPRDRDVSKSWYAQIALRSEREIASLAAMKGTRWKRNMSSPWEFMIETTAAAPEAALDLIERALAVLGFSIEDSDVWAAKADEQRREIDLPPALERQLAQLGFSPSEGQRAAHELNRGNRADGRGIFADGRPLS